MHYDDVDDSDNDDDDDDDDDDNVSKKLRHSTLHSKFQSLRGILKCYWKFIIYA